MREQIPDRDAEPVGDVAQDSERRIVAHATLDLADVDPGEAGALGEDGLGEAATESERADSSADLGRERGRFGVGCLALHHGRQSARLTPIRQCPAKVSLELKC